MNRVLGWLGFEFISSGTKSWDITHKRKKHISGIFEFHHPHGVKKQNILIIPDGSANFNNYNIGFRLASAVFNFRNNLKWNIGHHMRLFLKLKTADARRN